MVRRIVGLLLTTLALPLVLLGADPLLGTWKLNLRKSNYGALAPPRSITRTFLAPREGEIQFVVDEVTAGGTSVHIEWTGKYDGKDYPASGAKTYDTAAVKPSAGILEWAFRKSGRLAINATSVVSQDGKTLTITWTGKNPQGEALTVVHVYDKEL